MVGIATGEYVHLPSWLRTLRTRQRCSDVRFPVPSSAHPARHGNRLVVRGSFAYRGLGFSWLFSCSRHLCAPWLAGRRARLIDFLFHFVHCFLFRSSSLPRKSSLTVRDLFTCRRFGFPCGSSGGGCCLSSVPRSRLVLRTCFWIWSAFSH